MPSTWTIVYLFGTNWKTEVTLVLVQKEGFNLKDEDNLEDYLSCNIYFLKLGKEVWLEQPQLIAKSNQKFGNQ